MKFPRNILSDENASKTAEHLQQCLCDLVDLSLQLKQAHWNVVGPNFRSVHLQLDEILIDVRNGVDEVAERIVSIGAPADGRAASVAENTRLSAYPAGLQKVAETVSLVADRMHNTVQGLRSAIEPLGDLDPVSEDLLIATSAALEKHLWMLQSQELS